STGDFASVSMLGVGNQLYIASYETFGRVKLWKSDGTQTGTSLFREMPFSTNTQPITQLAELNGKLHFVADNGARLYATDGTAAGTAPVVSAPLRPRGLTSFDGKLYFTAIGSAGRELWTSDGTPAGTVQVRDLRSGTAAAFEESTTFTVFNGALY